jgi:two-component system, cell cycle sensor histidine kinase and response regulator CckA
MSDDRADSVQSKASDTSHLVEGKYAIQDLFDVERLRGILEDFSSATGYATGLASYPDQELLVGAGGRDLCTTFHRAAPESERHCKESNRELTEDLGQLEMFSIRTCEDGLVNGATPVIVKGVHVATLFAGQVFFEQPDLERLRLQGQGHGYDVEAYLSAVAEVPVVSEQALQSALSFLSSVAVMLAEQGLDSLALREARDKLRVVFDQAYQFIGLLTPRGRLLDANRASLEFGGLQPADVLGKPFWEAPWWTHSAALQEQLQDAVTRSAAGEFVRFEAEHPMPDGSVRYVDFSLTPVLDERGQVIFLVPEGRDITDRKLTEQALSAEKRFSETALNSLPGLFYVFNPDGTLLRWNRNLEQISGYSSDEIATMSVLDFFGPQDQEHARKSIQEVFVRGKNEMENHLLTRSGERRLHYFTGLLTEIDHKPYLVGMAIDIASRKRAEEALRESERRFQIIAEASSDIIYEWDVQTDELLWLGDIDLELGYPQGKIGQTIEEWVKLIHPDDLAQLNDAVERHRRSCESIEYTYRVKRGDGAWRHWYDRGFPILNADGLPRKWIGACSDITEQKSTEEQLRQSQKMEAIGRLAGGVAHDFNNILTGINGLSELLVDSLGPDDPMRADLEMIKLCGERAAGLTSQLLAFSRKQVISPKVVRPNEILEHSQKMLRRIISENVDLVFTLGQGVGRIKADPVQIDQVLVNLAVNAHDAMPGGGRLTIETRNVSLDGIFCERHINAKPGDYVELAVTDTGHGMDEETQSKVFEPFFSTKSKEQGTGLGLATVYGIVRQNSGFITLYSEPGLGTCFKVYFPRVMEEAETLTTEVIAALPTGEETVLLVEDEQVVRDLAARSLERLGYRVLAANSGEAASLLSDAHEGEIHLLLTDVVMPNMNGRELHEALLRTRPALKTLFMSGYTEDVIAHHGVLEQGIYFMNKPFTIATLARMIRSTLEG